MKFIAQYMLLVLLIANLTSQYVIFNPISNVLFYGVLGIGLVFSLLNCYKFLSKYNLKSTSILWGFILIYVTYQFTLGINYWNSESFNYLFAKVVVLLIIFWGITTNYDFYYRKMIPFLGIIIAILIVYGFTFHNEVFAGRSTCGFGNPNSTSAISSIGFASALLLDYKPRWLRIVSAIICLFGVLAGGSRTIIVVCTIAVFLKYEFSLRSIFLFAAVALIAVYAFPYFGFKLNGIDRIIDVFSNGNFVGSRGTVRKATLMMINEHPIIGWGFKSGIQGEAAQLTKLGSHNGYLDTIKAMGYPFAILLFSYMATILYKIRGLLKSENPQIRYHLFVTVAILLATLYESYIIGVNQIMTNLLFVSITILQYCAHYKLNSKEKK